MAGTFATSLRLLILKAPSVCTSFASGGDYINVSIASFRSCCDLMNTFFVIDEQTDGQPLKDVIDRCDMAMHAVLNPNLPRPDGECVIGEITRQ
jgi:hypothetical protein